MRLVFLGTPEFAVPTLEQIVAAGHEVAAVVTQPDRPRGRGQALAAPPVKQAALRLGLPVHQPDKIRSPEMIEWFRALAPEAMVVVGYGKLIPQAIIDIPPRGIVNVHASLLPKYRGAAPIQWAVANGETRTGVATMQIAAGLDTGDILLVAETEIGPEETAPELAARLAVMGAELLVRTLRENPRPTPQDDSQATYAPILKKEDGWIDWRRPASEIHNRIRGLLPWPGCYTRFRGRTLQIWRARVAHANANASVASAIPPTFEPIPPMAAPFPPGIAPAPPSLATPPGGAPLPPTAAAVPAPGEAIMPAGHPAAEQPDVPHEPGTLHPAKNRLFAACGDNTVLELLEVQLEGRKKISAEAFLHGHRVADNEKLGE